MAEYELNLNDYLRIFHKRKFIIIAVFLVVTIISIIQVSSQSPIYETFATVKILERQNIAGILTEWIVYTPADVMTSQAEIIKGFPIMKKVALQLDLIDNTQPPSEIGSVVRGLQEKISTEKIKNTNIIKIIATSMDPKEAELLANTTAQVYVEDNLWEKRKQASGLREFIQEQLDDLEGRLESEEERISELSEETKNIRLGEPIQKKLIELEFSLTTLKQTYTDKHPEVIELNEQIDDLRKELNLFSEEEIEYQRLYRKVKVNKKLYVMLKEKLEEARITEAQKIGDVSIVDPASPAYPIGPMKKKGILMGGFLGLLLGAALAFIIENLDTSIRSIEEMESLTKLPVLGVVPSIKDYIEEKENLFKKISMRFFPSRHKNVKKTEAYAYLVVYHEPKSQVSEAYRNIRTNLKLSPSLKTILVTSAGPREGKTTVVTNLGLTIALSGEKTLLVSSDLRRPAIAKTFGVKKEPGLNETITKVKTLDECLRNISDMLLGNMDLDNTMKSPGIENISLLPAGHIVDNPAEILESKEVQNLFSELKNKFDVIIFDSPPILPITDASLLAPKVDGVVLVYETGTTRNAFLRAKAQLESAGAKILGVILNHIKPEMEAAVGYPYYYKYKYYYGEKTDKKRKKFWQKKSLK